MAMIVVECVYNKKKITRLLVTKFKEGELRNRKKNDEII
jgi:hypothetical protein